MSVERIYRVDEYVEGSENAPGKPGQPRRVIDSFLIRAPNASQAIRHVAKRFTCEVATQDDLVTLCAKGIKVQSAGEGGDS